MKKERNTFFESNYNMTAIGPNVPNMMPNQMNNPNNFPYPTPLPIYPSQPNNSNYGMSELESRMAKLERNMNRLEARINKLEGSTFYSKDSYDDGNMYMV